MQHHDADFGTSDGLSYLKNDMPSEFHDFAFSDAEMPPFGATCAGDFYHEPDDSTRSAHIGEDFGPPGQGEAWHNPSRDMDWFTNGFGAAGRDLMYSKTKGAPLGKPTSDPSLWNYSDTGECETGTGLNVLDLEYGSVTPKKTSAKLSTFTFLEADVPPTVSSDPAFPLMPTSLTVPAAPFLIANALLNCLGDLFRDNLEGEPRKVFDQG